MEKVISTLPEYMSPFDVDRFDPMETEQDVAIMLNWKVFILHGLRARAVLNGCAARPILRLPNGRWKVQLVSSGELVTFLSTCGYSHNLRSSGDILSISMDNFALLDLAPLRDAVAPFEVFYAGLPSPRSSSSSSPSHE